MNPRISSCFIKLCKWIQRKPVQQGRNNTRNKDHRQKPEISDARLLCNKISFSSIKKTVRWNKRNQSHKNIKRKRTVCENWKRKISKIKIERIFRCLRRTTPANVTFRYEHKQKMKNTDANAANSFQSINIIKPFFF